MARPRKNPMTPEQAERRERLEDALRRAGLTWTAFCAAHGFVLETLWRWVDNGDPQRPPRNAGKPTSSTTIGQALGIDPTYLQAGGPRLWAAEAMPFRPVAVSPPVPFGANVEAAKPYAVFWYGAEGQGIKGHTSRRAAEREAITLVRGAPVGTKARVIKGETILAEWTKFESGAVKPQRFA